MASTSNNSGLNGDPEDAFGPDERYDDETTEQYNARMERKREYEERKREYERTKMPPCIG